MPYGISKIIIKYERSMKNKRKQPAKNIWNAQICKRKQKNTIEWSYVAGLFLIFFCDVLQENRLVYDIYVICR
jgi:hypothetical protein